MIRRVKAAWRRVPPKVVAQGARFVRVFVWTLVPAAVAGWQTHHLTLAVVVSLIPPALETAFRQVVTPPEAKQAIALLRDLVRPRVNVSSSTTVPTQPPAPPGS